MITKIIPFSELGGDNTRGCLTAQRALNKCHLCDRYMKCKSKKVNWKYDQLMRRKSKLTDQYQEELNKIKQEVDSL